MNVHQLLLENDFEQIWSKYSKSPKQKEIYGVIYNDLINKIPIPNDANFTLYMELVKDEDESYFHISGKYENDDQPYSISMTDWDEIVGYDVELSDYPVATFIIELLDEISFYGLEEDMIKQRDELSRRVQEIKNGTATGVTARDLLGTDDDHEESEIELAKLFIEAMDNIKNRNDN